GILYLSGKHRYIKGLGTIEAGRELAMTDATPKTTESFITRLGKFVEGDACQRFITGIIILNAIGLGLDTSPEIGKRFSAILVAADHIALGIFVFEILAKMAYRKHRFFLNGWNIFDFVIVGLALLPATGPLAVLRALRILRALRLLSVVPSMRKVVQALLSAIPGIGSVGLLISLIFYVGGVLTTKLFGPDFPDWFGNLGSSMYTLFQVMTLESWSMGIVRPVMETHPYAWVFFIPFILITSFAVLNLFIGIIVDAMQSQQQAEHDQEVHQAQDERVLILAEIAALRQDVKTLTELAQNQSNPK
ncbi:MAG: ion transporter, partial [Rhodospirillales bacterium]